MGKFDFQQIIDWFQVSITAPVEKYISALPPETLYLAIAASGLIALLAAIAAYYILKSSHTNKGQRPQGTQDFVQFFKSSGTLMDIAASGSHELILGRAVLTAARSEGLRIELIEENGISKLNPSEELILMFPPEKTEKGKVNSFKATIINLDCDKDGCGRITLSPPTGFSLIKRRRHKRKRVIDQQFIRVKLWRGSPDSDDTSFADAIPDLAVNSYDPRSTGHEDNQVINISNGGIGVSASPVLVDSKFSINDDVLINIFMFNFRQKVFKPYWYAGKIRSMENIDDSSYRLGVEFTMSGQMRDENEQNIDWSKI